MAARGIRISPARISPIFLKGLNRKKLSFRVSTRYRAVYGTLPTYTSRIVRFVLFYFFPAAHCHFRTGHDKIPLHGRGKNWNRIDIERLLHQLTLDGYLQEKMVPNREEIILSYIKLGPKADHLLRSGTAKVSASFLYLFVLFLTTTDVRWRFNVLFVCFFLSYTYLPTSICRLHSR